MDLRNRGTAILLTTHDLDQAQSLADRVGILRAGVLVREGAPADMLRASFDTMMELIVVLGKTDPAREAVLRQLGLQPASTPDNWICLAPPETLDLPAISRRLTTAGLTVKELRMRKPDLTSLYSLALRENGAR
jgi:ABC-2 type transport system ATP-binding protein